MFRKSGVKKTSVRRQKTAATRLANWLRAPAAIATEVLEQVPTTRNPPNRRSEYWLVRARPIPDLDRCLPRSRSRQPLLRRGTPHSRPARWRAHPERATAILQCRNSGGLSGGARTGYARQHERPSSLRQVVRCWPWRRSSQPAPRGRAARSIGTRSEERRVGKESSSGSAPYDGQNDE